VKSGTVSRLCLTLGPSDVTVPRKTRIAMGYTVQPNTAAVILGPTGLACDNGRQQSLRYHMAEKRYPPDQGLRESAPARPLVFAPNGNLLTANGDAVNSDPAPALPATPARNIEQLFRLMKSQGFDSESSQLATALTKLAIVTVRTARRVMRRVRARARCLRPLATSSNPARSNSSRPSTPV
jgi:hypothetical protein